MGILKMLGLITVEEHKQAINSANVELAKLGNLASDEKALRLKAEDETARAKRDWDRTRAERDDARRGFTDMQAKFKKAAQDIEVQSVRIAELNAEVAGLKAELAAADNRADSNQVDAQKWRDRAAREHARRTKSRAPASAPAKRLVAAPPPKPVAAKAKKGAGK